MKRLGIVLALVLASVSSIACTASTEEGQPASTEEGQEEHVGKTEEKLACRRFPIDTCVSTGTYCRNHGGQLWCDLYGNCTCVYGVLQQSASAVAR